jgi:hypothetical protein
VAKTALQIQHRRSRQDTRHDVIVLGCNPTNGKSEKKKSSLDVTCIVQCEIIMEYKPGNCTFSNKYFNLDVFYFGKCTEEL